ncbi:MAG: YceI family protein [Promicromonosporaceae bacterium]|nr:YceI family protein [Promicromonosporaceae bacterium]
MAGAVVVLGGAGLVWGPGLYASYVNGRADAAPALASATPLADPAGLDGTWHARSGSFAGYRVDEVLNGNHATVTGRTSQVTADVTLGAGTVTAAKVTVDMASIRTDEPPRDVYFRSTVIRTDQFPTSTFTLTGPVEIPRSGTAVDLSGSMTIHGVTRQVTLHAQVAQAADGEAQVVGSVPLTFADYGVQAPSLGFVTVEKHGSVEFDLLLGKAG